MLQCVDPVHELGRCMHLSLLHLASRGVRLMLQCVDPVHDLGRCMHLSLLQLAEFSGGKGI
jgi:hypothetical protein